LVWSEVELNITCTHNAINFAHNKLDQVNKVGL
jgi:hypothetical protein